MTNNYEIQISHHGGKSYRWRVGKATAIASSERSAIRQAEKYIKKNLLNIQTSKVVRSKYQRPNRHLGIDINTSLPPFVPGKKIEEGRVETLELGLERILQIHKADQEFEEFCQVCEEMFPCDTRKIALRTLGRSESEGVEDETSI